MNLALGFLAMLCGVLLTPQVGSNTQLGKFLGNPYIPAAVNMVVGVITTFALVLIIQKPWPQTANAAAAPWWMWLTGGTLGTVYLTGNILLAPKLGAAALVGFVVTGQLLFGVLCDHFGWLGFQQHSLTLWRAVGCVLMVGGVALIGKF
jgi:transporter family-2 protein